MAVRLTRRALVFGLPVCALSIEIGKGHTVPNEAKRYADSATDLDVVRLTSPEHTSVLPSPWLRSISKRQGFLIYSSDRSGSMQAWRMDLKSGESKMLTEAAALDPASLALSSDERSFFYFDGLSLRHSYFSTLRDAEICSLPEGRERCEGFALSDDGLYAAFGEKTDNGSRVQLVGIVRRAVSTVASQSFAASDFMFRPRRAQLLYRGDSGLWIADLTGENNRRLKTAPAGELGPARWSPTGRTVLYLHFPGEKQLNMIREITPDENTDKPVSKTSQFVQFGMNGDASVFVGASRNAGSPYLLLLLRQTRRELSLCEHHSSDAAKVNPVFSPDSQRIFFQSDRDGKPAIYRIRVEKFVEETEG